MNETNAEIPYQEPPAMGYPELEKPKKKIPIAAWIAGCAALLCACAAVLAIAGYFGLPLLQSDPLAAVTPGDSLVYMSFDLAQARSDKVNEIFGILQDLAETEEKDTTPIDSLDRVMQDEWDMSFTDDIMPWIGQHAAFAVTEGNLDSDGKFMLILETRNTAKSDEFLEKFVASLEDDGMEFEKSEEDGITFYIDSSYEETVLARSGKFVYLSNSQDTVLESVNLKKSDSLASSPTYKDGMAALPRNRLATVYFSNDMVDQALEEFGGEFGMGTTPYTKDLMGEGLSGFVMSLSVVDAGLRLDAATIYDTGEITEYQKQAMATKYLSPKADSFFPADTFFFVGARTSKAPGDYTEVDNPLYSGDVKESFDLLEQQYGIDIRELIDLLGDEVAVGIGPASDGLFADSANTNMGFMVLAGTKDEKGIVDWFDNVLEKSLEDVTYMSYDTNDTTIGNFEMKELTVEQGSDNVTAFIYGAGKGYFILGTSPSMLENGLTGKDTLAKDPVYRKTWSAFPRSSVPYMYVNLSGFMDFLVDNSDEFGGGDDMRDIQRKLENIPVIAMAVNNSSRPVQSITVIVFVETNK